MKISPGLFDGHFGIERETLRIDKFGRLAQTSHPFPDDDNITRDFCENQIELITPVCSSIDQALASLEELDKRTAEKLEENGESLWLYSNPPHFNNENDIPIARFSGTLSSKRSYREVLERKYGKKLMLFSGIHFNFSFTDQQLKLWNTSGINEREFRDSLYLRLYKQLMTHSWLIVYLTAASPFYDLSLDKDGKKGIIKREFASLRNSSRGYWNQFIPVLDHSSIQSFCDSIISYINKGMLFSASELYLPVRLKPKGLNTIEALRDFGVDHIELRMFDLNPLSPLAIDSRDLEFAHLLILYLISLPDICFDQEQQKTAVITHQNAALIEPGHELAEKAESILNDMSDYFSDYSHAADIVCFEKSKLKNGRLCSSIDQKDIYR